MKTHHPVAVSAWQILIGNIVRQITDRGELVVGGGGRYTVIEYGGGATRSSNSEVLLSPRHHDTILHVSDLH